MKTAILTHDALGNPIHTFTVTFTEVGGEGRSWSARIRETDNTIVGQWPRAVKCLAKDPSVGRVRADRFGPRIFWQPEEGPRLGALGTIIVHLDDPGKTLEIKAVATCSRPVISWKYEYPLDSAGRVPHVGPKKWIGRVDGEVRFIVQKDGGEWKSSTADWVERSKTKEEAFSKCEGYWARKGETHV